MSFNFNQNIITFIHILEEEFIVNSVLTSFVCDLDLRHFCVSVPEL